MPNGLVARSRFAEALGDETGAFERPSIVFERIHPSVERHLEAIPLETTLKRPPTRSRSPE